MHMKSGTNSNLLGPATRGGTIYHCSNQSALLLLVLHVPLVVIYQELDVSYKVISLKAPCTNMEL